LGPNWPQIAPKSTPTGPRTTSNRSHMSCSQIHRSPIRPSWRRLWRPRSWCSRGPRAPALRPRGRSLSRTPQLRHGLPRALRPVGLILLRPRLHLRPTESERPRLHREWLVPMAPRAGRLPSCTTHSRRQLQDLKGRERTTWKTSRIKPNLIKY
jgi:hypothetical protein